MATTSDPLSSAHFSPPPPPPATTIYPSPPPPPATTIYLPPPPPSATTIYPPPPPPPATTIYPPPPPPTTNGFPHSIPPNFYPPPIPPSQSHNIRPSTQPHFFNSPIFSPAQTISAQFDQPTPISTPVPLKLTHTNFLPWQAQILPLIHGHNLAKFLTLPPPNPTRQGAGGQIEFNYEYLLWNRQDMLLLRWLRATLSESVAAQVVSCTSSAALWSTLHQQFSSNSRARLIDLKRQLQSAQRGSSTCTEFLQHIRSIGDELAFIGASPSDDDLILALLNGLGTEFNSFVAALTTQSRAEPLPFSAVHGMLLSHEALLKGQLQLSLPSSSAFVANRFPASQSKRNNNAGNRSGPNSKPNTSSQPNRNIGFPLLPAPQPANNSGASNSQVPKTNNSNQPPRQCQICKKYGHIAKYCRWRYQSDPSYQQNSTQPPPQQPQAQAFVAQPSNGINSSD